MEHHGDDGASIMGRCISAHELQPGNAGQRRLKSEVGNLSVPIGVEPDRILALSHADDIAVENGDGPAGTW